VERDRFEDREGSARGPLAGSVLLIVLPTVFLGATYFLLVEYTLRDLLAGAVERRLALRLGGGALIFLSPVLSVGFGWLVVDRLMRPLRLLLRLPENGGLLPRGAPLLHTRIREYHDLYRLLGVLLNQQKAGTRALEELEELREALAHLREELSRTGQHGIPPLVTAVGPLRDIGASLAGKRHHLLAFFADLRERVQRLREELVATGAAAGLVTDAPSVEASPALEEERAGAAASATPAGPADEPAPAERLLPVSHSVERLRQIGTVLALEAARVGGSPGKRASELLERFHGGLAELEELLGQGLLDPAGRNNGDREAAERVAGNARARAEDLSAAECAAEREAVRVRWAGLIEGLEALERRLAEAEER